CARDCKIAFNQKQFCFTGPAKTGTRKNLEEIVTALGGIPKNNVVLTLDYLVIGAQSSPCWAYSTYGRKIEKAIELKRKGRNITILHENDFIDQAT
ncbi:MAG: BRCT domain-containing protein, partial [Desulfobacterales bacterium]